MNNKYPIQTCNFADFPLLLQQIDDPPKQLFYRGNLKCWQEELLAVVGTRQCSAYGRQVAGQIAGVATTAGIVLVSGLALGIDGAAQEVAVRQGKPTIAVLAHGLDHIYPAAHRKLAMEILNCGGLLLSEYPPGVRAQKYHFIQRNRIIAGLGSLTVIVEAGKPSGAMSTARFALDYHREVWAVPGRITDPQAAGTLDLIDNGARPLLDPLIILEHFGLKAHSAPSLYTPEEKLILIQLDGMAKCMNELQAATSLDFGILASTVCMLELNGTVKQGIDGRYHRLV